MDIPVDLLLFGELGVFDREDLLGNPWCKDGVDEGIAKKRTNDFVDMKRKSCKVEIVGERLNCLAQPGYWWDREGIVHCRGY